MTQEHKELLLKDLCSRLPYGVKYMKYSWGYGLDQEIPEVEVLECVDKNGYISNTKVYTVEDIKPYLFPLSSMTEEQKRELLELTGYEQICEESCGFNSRGVYINIVGEYEYEYENNQESIILYIDDIGIDWCNKNHFDYRGLIPKGLAIDATGLNIY